MALEWKEWYADQRIAECCFGKYCVGDADSIGWREVHLRNKGADYYIGQCLSTREGKNIAQNHYDFLVRTEAAKARRAKEG